MELVISNAKTLGMSYVEYIAYAVNTWGFEAYELVTKKEYLQW